MRRIPEYDCIIVGGGPGGLVTAVYLSRFKRRVALVHSGIPRASWIPRTHNLIGYDRGISGALLLQRLHRQLNRMELDQIHGVATVRKNGRGFRVSVEGGGELRAKTVVIATGIEDVHPKIPNLDDLRKKGLLRYCSICDGWEYRDQPIAVLARDMEGITKALFLRNWSKDVRIILPQDFKLAPQVARKFQRLRIRYNHCHSLTMEHSRSPEGLSIRLDGTKPVHCRVAYVELGCVVNDRAFAGIRGLRRSQAGFIITTQEQRTSVPGLFAVGDCVNLLGQISVAAGQAAVAATTIHNDLL